MRKLWVFDLDDTLMYTFRAYDAASARAARVIKTALGNQSPPEADILALESRITRDMVNEINPDTGTPYFYCRDRFPRSLQDTYVQLCQSAGEPDDEGICRQLLSIGYQVFDPARYVRDIKPGARELLAKLHQDRSMNEVVIITKGDRRIQEEKVGALMGAGLFWDRDIIVENDKRSAFEDLVRSTSDMHLITVGDNYVSDIRPAVELGYRGVWVNVYNWETNHKNAELLQEAKKSGVRIIGELTELLIEPLIGC